SELDAITIGAFVVPLIGSFPISKMQAGSRLRSSDIDLPPSGILGAYDRPPLIAFGRGFRLCVILQSHPGGHRPVGGRIGKCGDRGKFGIAESNGAPELPVLEPSASGEHRVSLVARLIRGDRALTIVEGPVGYQVVRQARRVELNCVDRAGPAAVR